MALKIRNAGNSLAVQWLGLQVLTAEGWGSIPGQELRSHKLQVSGQKKRKRKTYCGPHVLQTLHNRVTDGPQLLCTPIIGP